jgi:putative transposon-encoded protein
MKVTMTVDADKVLTKTVAKTNGGKQGMIYLPKELIGKNVSVIIE